MTADPLRFLALGGADEVGASSYLYLLREGRLLIDFGMRPGQVGEAARPDLGPLADFPPDAILVTHAHLDHLAALPVVAMRYRKAPIYCTPATAKIAPLVLADTLKVSTAQGMPAFSEAAMVSTLNRLKEVPYFQKVSDHGFAFTLFPAGHLLGGASVMIESGGKSVFHTGDVSNIAGHTTEAAFMPKVGLEVDAVVSEATYGDTILPARKDQIRGFVSAVGEVLARGGHVLIPSFALGRAQELVRILNTAQVSGLIPGVPIYLDGLTREMTARYEELVDEMPTALRNAKANSRQPAFLSGNVERVENKNRGKVIEGGPSIVIASSGMLHAGASPMYARAWLPDANNALLVVGYQDAESPGRRLLELERGGEVMLPDGRGEVAPVTAYAEVKRFQLSAHADQIGLVALIKRYGPGKLLLTHGEVAPRIALAKVLDNKMEVSLPKNGELVDLQDSGRRRKTFMGSSGKSKAGPMKQKHRKGVAHVSYDPDHHVLVIDLPENMGCELFGVGDYTMEVTRMQGTRMKFVERLGEVSAEEATLSAEVEDNATA